MYLRYGRKKLLSILLLFLLGVGLLAFAVENSASQRDVARITFFNNTEKVIHIEFWNNSNQHIVKQKKVVLSKQSLRWWTEQVNISSLKAAYDGLDVNLYEQLSGKQITYLNFVSDHRGNAITFSMRQLDENYVYTIRGHNDSNHINMAFCTMAHYAKYKSCFEG